MIPQNFKSVTIWQGEPQWEIEVTVGGFPTAQAADDFGCERAKRLIHPINADYLILEDSLGNYHKIEQNQVVVSKLKPECQQKLFTSEDDLAIANISIKDFSITKGLDRGFESLAYGVIPDN